MRRFIIILLILAGIGAGSWFLYQSSRNSLPPSNTEGAGQPTDTAQSAEPVVPDPFPHDKDRDGVNDAKEKEMGTSDTDFDTDHDGLSDVDEVNVWKTDPKKTDTDGDGFGDGLEVFGGFNPRGAGKL